MAHGTEKKRIKVTAVRRIVLGCVFALIVVGAFAHGPVSGTLSNIGVGYIAYVCPLGSLEAMLGQWAFVPRLAVAVAAVVVLALVLGRSFCAWACPVPPLFSLFKSKKVAAADERGRQAVKRRALGRREEGDEEFEPEGSASRNLVLAGALALTAVFGFPVFCLVCPVGLTFALVIGLVNLVAFNEPSWSLVIFAAVLLVEAVFLRKWCARICPIGALLSLVARLNRTFRPQVDRDACLRSRDDGACGACSLSCPQLIDPHGDKGLRPLSDCTRCGACVDACPQGALKISPLPARTARQKDEQRD